METSKSRTQEQLRARLRERELLRSERPLLRSERPLPAGQTSAASAAAGAGRASRQAPAVGDVNLFESLMAGESDASSQAPFEQSSDPVSHPLPDQAEAARRFKAQRSAASGADRQARQAPTADEEQGADKQGEEGPTSPGTACLPPPLPLMPMPHPSTGLADRSPTTAGGQRPSMPSMPSHLASPFVASPVAHPHRGTEGGVPLVQSPGSQSPSAFEIKVQTRDFGELVLTAEPLGGGWRVRLTFDDPQHRQSLYQRREAIARGLSRQLGQLVEVEIDA